jgi:hypothetical protein
MRRNGGSIAGGATWKGGMLPDASPLNVIEEEDEI